jgi:hypothetical protein
MISSRNPQLDAIDAEIAKRQKLAEIDAHISQRKQDQNLGAFRQSPNQSMFAPLLNSPHAAQMPEGKYANQEAQMLVSNLIPVGRLSNRIPGISGVKKYATDLLGSMLQNGAISGGMNALNTKPGQDMGEQFGEGAAVGAGATAIINPLASLLGHGNPLVRLASAALLGGGATAAAGLGFGHHSSVADVGGAALAAALALRGGNAKDLVLKNIISKINPEEALPRAQAAERLNLTIKPEEADPNAYLGAVSGKLGKTAEGSEKLFQFDQKRSGEEKNAISKLLDTIYDKSPESAQSIRNLYSTAYKWNVKPEVLGKFKDDELINQAFENVQNDVAYRKKLLGVPENNYQYLDQVKRALNDMEGVAKRAGNNDKARIITGTRKEFENVLDSSNPTYKDARAEAQKSIIRSQMEKKLNMTSGRGTEFARKFLNNDDKFNDLVKALSNAPKAQDQLRDMKQVFPYLINENSSRSSYKLMQNNMPKARNTKDSALDFLHSLQGAKYDKAAIDLTRSRNWVNEISNLGKLQGVPGKTLTLADILARNLGIGLNNAVKE